MVEITDQSRCILFGPPCIYYTVALILVCLPITSPERKPDDEEAKDSSVLFALLAIPLMVMAIIALCLITCRRRGKMDSIHTT